MKNQLEVKVKGQDHIMGLVRLEKASNVARSLFSDYEYSQKNVKKHIGIKCRLGLCTTIFQKVMVAFFKMAAIPSMKITFLGSFFPNLCDFNDIL